MARPLGTVGVLREVGASAIIELLGLRRHGSYGEKVAILVGPNGAGKSNFLKGIAEDLRYSRSLAIICNTAYDRFSGMRGIKRMSASRAGRSPKSVIKDAIGKALNAEDSRFYQVSRILNYCGYAYRIGFSIERGPSSGQINARDLIDIGCDVMDAELSASFFARYKHQELIWVDPGGSKLEYSQAREFASVLKIENELKKHRYVRDIRVFLERKTGETIELLNASSGELSLISSLVFLIANGDEEPVVLTDEPENSLHPSWQREYVDKVLNALEYRSATVIVATHSPLVVTGALARYADLVSVFQINRGDAKKLVLSSSKQPTESIEEILWRAFEVITPSSHFVSEELVDVIAKVESGEMKRETALARVEELDERSFDDQQRAFLGGVRRLIVKVDEERQDTVRDA